MAATASSGSQVDVCPRGVQLPTYLGTETRMLAEVAERVVGREEAATLAVVHGCPGSPSVLEALLSLLLVNQVEVFDGVGDFEGRTLLTLATPRTTDLVIARVGLFIVVVIYG